MILIFTDQMLLQNLSFLTITISIEMLKTKKKSKISFNLKKKKKLSKRLQDACCQGFVTRLCFMDENRFVFVK